MFLSTHCEINFSFSYKNLSVYDVTERWRKAKEPDRWIGVFGNRVWILEQKDDHILYQVLPEEKSDLETDHEKLLRDYFQLDYDLRDLYEDWSGKDPNFKKAAQQFYGIRILKQDPVENIFSFICSSNNNIARISSMVEKLAKFYGTKICDFDQVEYYSFPEIRALAEDGVEKKLKENGFGYRAKYVSESAKAIVKGGGSKWVEELKALEYKEAKKKLMTLTGIGAKVKSFQFLNICSNKFFKIPGGRLCMFNVFGASAIDTHRHPHLSNSFEIIHAKISKAEDGHRKDLQ